MKISKNILSLLKFLLFFIVFLGFLGILLGRNKYSPLHDLIFLWKKEDPEIVRRLNQAIEDRNYKEIESIISSDDDYLEIKLDEKRNRPIHAAALIGDVELIKLLLKHGANVNDDRNKIFFTPLHFAASKGHIEAIKYLVENGADIDANDNEYEVTPLSSVIVNNNLDGVKILLELGADPNKLVMRSSCLHKAVIKDNVEIIKLLLEHGAEINIASSGGNTPLHYAVLDGRTIIAKVLVYNGANVNIKNDRGEKPIDIVNKRSNPELAEFLKSFNLQSIDEEPKSDTQRPSQPGIK